MYRLIALMLLATLTGSASLRAQTADPADVDPLDPEATPQVTETDAQSAGPATAPDEVNAEATPSSEVFIPTEEISEDFAVSFPVDI